MKKTEKTYSITVDFAHDVKSYYTVSYKGVTTYQDSQGFFILDLTGGERFILNQRHIIQLKIEEEE